MIGTRHKMRSILFFSLVFFILSGCALLGFSSGEKLAPKSENYRVKAPSSWKEIKKGDSDQAFELPTKAVVVLNSTCQGVTAESPLTALTRHLLIGMRKIQTKEQKSMTVDGKEGLFSRVEAKANKQPIYLELLVMKAGDCVVDFTLLNKQPISAGESAEFKQFFESFHYDRT